MEYPMWVGCPIVCTLIPLTVEHIMGTANIDQNQCTVGSNRHPTCNIVRSVDSDGARSFLVLSFTICGRVVSTQAT